MASRPADARNSKVRARMPLEWVSPPSPQAIGVPDVGKADKEDEPIA